MVNFLTVVEPFFYNLNRKEIGMSDLQPEKEYLTLAEVAAYVGVKRASLYYYINPLNIQMHKFNLDRRSYISLADAKRIKEVKEKPWTAGEKQVEKKSEKES